MSNPVYLTLGCFVSLLVIVHSSPFNDPCTLMPNGPALPGDDEIKDVFTTTSCLNGSIWWNYPRGTLRVHFRYTDSSKEFRVCLKSGIGPSFRAAYDVTGGKHKVFPVPQGRDEEQCTESVAAEIILLVEQPPFQTYMTLYDYKLEFIN
ncbi:hypothetical protein LOTGIDRAFT_166855 [Lottia gigantea]|uniref:CUB domain-containing protein n=1 Tax=Lottia gigantea TaxID=225164 RepID=V3Z7R6_LOTGI|nr:hypothetical protein LOTGIDRAFT_166855 [Lottia gigantea]ESO86853.1 hypothetical protein LOTGIDRAFT_166855 [Lottia gigantea]